MSGGDASEEKTLPPSAKKLREAREKGQIAHSKEMVTAAVTLASFAYLLARVPAMLGFLEDGLLALPDHLDRPFAAAVGPLAARLERDALWALAPLIGTIVASAVLANVAVNGGVLASLDPIAPKMERLDPAEGFKRMFGLKSLVEASKSVLKLVALTALAVLVIRQSLQAVVELPSCGLACTGPVAAGLLKALVLPMLGLFLVLGGLDPIAPKMERLDPAEGFKRMFGLKGLVEAVKAMLKLAAVTTLAVLIIRLSLQALVELPSCGLTCAGPVAAGLFETLVLPMVGLFLVVGGLDVGLQRWLFRRDMRMTKTEQKRERKDQEGDPLIRRQHRQERRLGSAKAGVRNATFVIRSAQVVLALRYMPPDALVPVLVARGAGEAGLAMLEDARAAGLPVVFDAAATALVAGRVKVGGLIAKDMFQAVIACMHEARVL